MTDLVTRLVPMLGIREPERFNVFEVMHHGTHEKQVSNVFKWLLDPDGSHRLGDLAQRIFIDAINRATDSRLRPLPDDQRVPYGDYSVRAEVDVSGGKREDIADLVLEDHATAIVIENYHVSDPHGHSYELYSGYAALGDPDRTGLAVMLCHTVDRERMTGEWAAAPIVSYADVIAPLMEHVNADATYRGTYPEQAAFLEHLERRFLKGRRVNTDNLIEFIDALCQTDNAELYRWKNREDAALRLADQVREDAIERFLESRDVLARAKRSLVEWGRTSLRPQLAEALGTDVITNVSAGYHGLYEWTINLHGPEEVEDPVVQIKFGPSAWAANTQDDGWKHRIPSSQADYSKLFLTRRSDMSVHQSSVPLSDVVGIIAADDRRLVDEIVDLLR